MTSSAGEPEDEDSVGAVGAEAEGERSRPEVTEGETEGGEARMELEAWGATLGGLQLVSKSTEVEKESRFVDLDLDAEPLRRQ